MQLIVEPGLGLCDNLKPNRFFGIERKRLIGTGGGLLLETTACNFLLFTFIFKLPAVSSIPRRDES